MVEVKFRRSVQDGLNAVGYTSQRRISNACDLWLAKQPDYDTLSVRFDIIIIQRWRLPVHFKDAF